MKKLLALLGVSIFLFSSQSFITTYSIEKEKKHTTASDEITFKIKNDSGSGIRLQFKGSGGDSGTMSMNSNITTEFTKAEGCKVYNYETEKLLFIVSSDMAGKTLKISDYQ